MNIKQIAKFFIIYGQTYKCTMQQFILIQIQHWLMIFQKHVCVINVGIFKKNKLCITETRTTKLSSVSLLTHFILLYIGHTVRQMLVLGKNEVLVFPNKQNAIQQSVSYPACTDFGSETNFLQQSKRIIRACSIKWMREQRKASQSNAFFCSLIHLNGKTCCYPPQNIQVHRSASFSKKPKS